MEYSGAPWKVVPDDDPSDFYVITPDELQVAAVCGEANAHLISASPDLLAACETLIESAESEGWDRYRGTNDPRTGFSEVRAAIAKARGQ